MILATLHYVPSVFNHRETSLNENRDGDFERASGNRLITFDLQNSTYRERLSISHKTSSRTKKAKLSTAIYNLQHLTSDICHRKEISFIYSFAKTSYNYFADWFGHYLRKKKHYYYILQYQILQYQILFIQSIKLYVILLKKYLLLSN